MLFGRVIASGPNVFALLGASPLLGRAFRPEEGVPGAPRVAMLSERFWRARLGAREDVLGTTIAIAGEPYTIVGVMPETFVFPLPVTELWTPHVLDPAVHDAGYRGFQVVARLRPGVGPDQAAAVEQRGVERDRVGEVFRILDQTHQQRLPGRHVESAREPQEDRERDQVPHLRDAGEHERREHGRLDQQQRLPEQLRDVGLAFRRAIEAGQHDAGCPPIRVDEHVVGAVVPEPHGFGAGERVKALDKRAVVARPDDVEVKVGRKRLHQVRHALVR